MTGPGRAGGGAAAPALARDPGVSIPGLGAEPAEPGHLLSHTHFQHLGPTYPLASPPPSPHILAARPTLPWPSTRQPTGQHCTPSPALEQVPEAMGMCRGFGEGGEGKRSPHHHPALPLSFMRSPGLAPKPVCPDPSLLSCAPTPSFAPRGAGPGRIPRAERGRAESGARGRGPAGV